MIPRGSSIIIPCATAAGPFSDEKVVWVTAGGLDWLGFVEADKLQERDRSWFILGTVVGCRSGSAIIRLPGHSPTGNTVRLPRNQITPVQATT